MDVVRTHVERAGGMVELESHLGKGTTIRMKMPLTLAIIPALLVRDGEQRFAIPQANLLELVYLDEEQTKKDIEYVRGAPIYRLRGEILPLVKLSPLLRHPTSEHLGVNIVVVAIGARRYGLVVEAIQDTEEIVIKPLHSMIKKLPCYAGATVLGDGGVALILDVAGIATMAGIEMKGAQEFGAAEATAKADETTQSMLIFTAGENARCAVPVSMLARLEQVDAKAIEMVAGGEVLQYRGELMPIIRPESALPIGSPPPMVEDGVQQLLVFNFGRPVGLAVTAILDTAEVEATHPSDVPMTLGKTVVFSRTTLIVDVFALVRQLAPGCVSSTGGVMRRPRVLLADEVDAMRASLAGFLRASGLDVVETTNEAVVRELRNHSGHQFDAVVASVSKGKDVSVQVKQEQPGLPLVCVTNDATNGAAIKRVERELVLEALVAAGVFSKEVRAS
jgi:two-component system chemotaxis sensor kinase CheA